MLQIRLNKGAAGDGGGGAAVKPPPSVDVVTVACPDHLVIADLPVAKSIGAITSAAAYRNLGRRSRRKVGERVHFCVRCDLPIAIYGRLVPCEHAFCLTCARGDPSCYICEERVQKIQSIKMMEGIFICAAPHCLKSFLKQSDLGSHIFETHADLLQSNTTNEDGDGEARASTDTHWQPLPQEISAAHAPQKPGFSPSMNTQQQDRHHPATDHPPSMLSEHLKPMLDNSSSWIDQSQSFMGQAGPQNRFPSEQLFSEKHAVNPLQTSFMDTPPLQPPLPPGYHLSVNPNQAIVLPAAFSYPPSVEGSERYYTSYEIPRSEAMPAGGPVQASLMRFSPAPSGISNFAGSAPQTWGTSQPFILAQGVQEGYMNLTDSQGRFQSSQGDGGQLSGGWMLNNSQIGQGSARQGVSAVNSDNSGRFVQLPHSMPLQVPLPPPPPLPQ